MIAPTDLAGANPRSDLRPNIINNSWGGGGGDSWYQNMVTSWIAAGIFPMFSNGNSGPNCATAGSPGDYLTSYSSGAFDSNNAIAGFSSRGTSGGEIKPNIAAPGVNIRSAVANGGYSAFDGTSMASPHVAGTIALMWSASPALIGDITATRALLDGTAIDTEDLQCGGTAADNNVWGEGRLDAFGAVEQSPRGPLGALSGTVTDAGTSNPVQGARVQVVGPVSRSILTSPSGAYAFDPLPIGDYDVTVSAFGYETDAATGVVVTESVTTIHDVALVVVPTHTVSGIVKDSRSRPLIDATVSLSGTPIAPATTNASGEYTFVGVPEDDYIVLAAAHRCTVAQTQPLTVDSDETLDITLAAVTDSFGYVCDLQSSAYIEANTQLTVPGDGDDESVIVALPFSFTFYGQTFSQALVSTNGFLSFQIISGIAASNGAIPSSANPNAAIYPFWDDFVVDASASLRTESFGSAPNRQFVIEWRNMHFYEDTGRRVDVEVVLHENGRILTQYRNIAADGREQGNSATLGIESQAGTVALQYSLNQAVVSDAVAVLYQLPALPPVADDDSATTPEDQAISIDVLTGDSDPDGGDLSVDSVTQPANGVATLNKDDTITYTPNANFHGSDTFTYQNTNGTSPSESATVTVNVTPVNDVPVVVVRGGGSCDAIDASAGSIFLLVADIENTAGSLTVTANSSNTLLLPDAQINFSGTDEKRVLAIAADTAQTGTAIVTVTVSDGVDTGTVVVTVIVGTDADETLTATGGPHMLFGRDGDDEIMAGGGNDLLCGGEGNDRLLGRQGFDAIDGGTGSDTLLGGDGYDTLIGGTGPDRLDGGNGRDLLRGNLGNDTLNGGMGNDQLIGGPGADAFRGGAGVDTYPDYNIGEGDLQNGMVP